MKLYIAVLNLAVILGLAIAKPAGSRAAEMETVKPLFESSIPNIPGKKIVAVLVEYAPNGKSLSHRHAKSAFVYAYVIAGSLRSALDTAPAQIFEAGESFTEKPGTMHRVSENASESLPARLLVVFIVDSDDNGPLTTSLRKPPPSGPGPK